MELSKNDTGIEAPNELGEHGKKAWRDAVSHLQANGGFKKIYRPSLITYCYNVDIVFKCMKMFLDDKGIVVDHENNKSKVNSRMHPAIQIWNSANTNINAAAKKFGFTPYDESKLPKVEKKKDKRFGGMKRNVA